MSKHVIDSVLINDIRKRAANAGSQKAVAAQLGISAQYLNDLVHRRREISPQVAKALGYERHVVFVRIED